MPETASMSLIENIPNYNASLFVNYLTNFTKHKSTEDCFELNTKINNDQDSNSGRKWVSWQEINPNVD
jgi:hypothetical protein